MAVILDQCLQKAKLLLSLVFVPSSPVIVPCYSEPGLHNLLGNSVKLKLVPCSPSFQRISAY